MFPAFWEHKQRRTALSRASFSLLVDVVVPLTVSTYSRYCVPLPEWTLARYLRLLETSPPSLAMAITRDPFVLTALLYKQPQQPTKRH